VKVSKLRELSGALWDENNFVIVLDDEHYIYKGISRCVPVWCI
jgi:hypothetical protein